MFLALFTDEAGVIKDESRGRSLIYYSVLNIVGPLGPNEGIFDKGTEHFGVT